jgi:predicted DNA-binding protein (MmcQ/YjbR family)
MNIEELRTYCMHKPGVTEEFPFGESTIVFKVAGKIFALADLQSSPVSFNLKCDPELAVQLRDTYSCVTPGYHMNKKHWNTVIADATVPRRMLEEWVDNSYRLVVSGLSKNQKSVLQEQPEPEKNQNSAHHASKLT